MADWLGFAGNVVGGVIGCAGTIAVFWKQLKREDRAQAKQQTEQERQERWKQLEPLYADAGTLAHLGEQRDVQRIMDHILYMNEQKARGVYDGAHAFPMLSNEMSNLLDMLKNVRVQFDRPASQTDDSRRNTITLLAFQIGHLLKNNVQTAKHLP